MSLDSGLDNPSYVETERPSNANGNGNVSYHSNGGVGYSNKSNGDLVAHEVEGDEGTVTMRSHEKNGLPHDGRLSTISGTSQTELVGKDDEVATCGWMSFRPRAIQHLYGPRGFLLFLCIFVLAQSMTCNGFVYVVTSTLERRFNLSSTKSGAISSAYDFTVMAIVVFVTYFGEKGHKPMWLGVGAIIFGIGSWMFTLPHFLTGPYRYGTTFEDTCPLNTTALDENICKDDENLSRYYGFFIVAQVLHGFGSCSIYTHGQTYIYNNVKAGEASMYIGIFMAVSTFAPALGYILGALFLSVFTDITNDSVDITVTSPLWVGAWWIGFIISGSLSLLVSIPLFAFPRNLPGWKEAELDRVNTAQAGSDFSMKAGFEGSIKDFPRAVWNLLRNVPLMCVNFAVSSENMIVASVAVFGPKYIESMFSITAKNAALIVGLAVFPTSLLGCLLGGWLIKKYNWLFRGQIRMVLFSLGFSWICMLTLMLTCPNLPMVGVTRDYASVNETISRDDINLTASCNVHCSCGDEYDPVCGETNDVIYYSACHAGCQLLNDDDIFNKVYSNCSCIPPSKDSTMFGGTAFQGRCTYPLCNIAAPFLLCVIIVLFTSLLIIVPSVTMLYAVVSPDQRTTAMGVQSLMYRALGTVPGPIIFGSLIDRACLIWEYSDCDDDGGVCWLYDNDDFGGYAFKILFSCRFVTICFFVLAYVFYKPISEMDPEQGQESPFEDGAQSNVDLPSNLEVDDSVIFKSYKVRSD